MNEDAAQTAALQFPPAVISNVFASDCILLQQLWLLLRCQAVVLLPLRCGLNQWSGIRLKDFVLKGRLRLWHEAGHFLPVAGLQLQGWCVFAAEVLLPDFSERHAELLNTEGVDNRVDSGVAVSEQDGDVEEHDGLLAVWAKECDAVDDVEGQPAEGKEEKDQSQRFGQI